MSAIECVKLVFRKTWLLAAISRFALGYGQFCLRARLAAMPRPGSSMQLLPASGDASRQRVCKPVLLKEVNSNTSSLY